MELEKDYPNEILSFRDYSIEVEKNNHKARVAIYVKKCITSHRRCDLEGKNSNLVVLDLDLNSKFRLINVYRLFNPPENNKHLLKMHYWRIQQGNQLLLVILTLMML